MSSLLKDQSMSKEEGMSPEVGIDWIGGNCPVQAEGTIDGREFYFRARGEHWSLSIGGSDIILDPEWYYEEEYGEEDFAAGWMTEDEARAFIAKAAELYRTSLASDRVTGSIDLSRGAPKGDGGHPNPSLMEGESHG